MNYTHWETVAVTALPAGWRNVYRAADGTITTAPCPAILLQEGRLEAEGDGPLEPCEPPYITRAVFACREDQCLEPVEASNYVATIGPGEAPALVAAEPTTADRNAAIRAAAAALTAPAGVRE